MRLSKFTIGILICIIGLSILFAKLANVVRVNYDDFETLDAAHGGPSRKAQPHPDLNFVIGDDPEPLLWFIQISDIHVSLFHDPDRINEFRDFCNVTVDVIKPSVVVASGDLADAKNIDNMGSRQFLEEWVYYSEILEETRVGNRTLWLDIRGNHDNFNVPSIHKHTSFYHQFSLQGKRHKRSYMYTVKDGNEKYSFIGVDATLNPGPRRPLNFIGRITPEEYKILEKFEKESADSNATIWFGHYPTSCILSPEPGFRSLMKNAVVYLCGHLHTLGGMVPNMYTKQQNGFLELELGDWKENRLYRIAAFDHGLFSFVDVPHGQWPVILVTNPKHALFNLPRKENFNFMSNSTHIRLLVFSPSLMETVRVKVDNEDWIECHNVQGPLFVALWKPEKFSHGVHQIYVYARNKDGQATEINQPFALDDSRIHFQLLPRIALMTDATTVFFSVFVALIVLSVTPLLAVRLLQFLVKEQWVAGPELRMKRGSGLLRKIWILCTIDKLYYPMVIYPVYLTIGPWFIGEVIDGHWGAAFAWGTYVDGGFLPGAFSYLYGVIQLFWFHIPFIIVLSHSVDLRFRMVCLEGKPISYSSQVWNNVPCAVLLFFQAIFAYFFYLAYGTMALFLGPLRTWSVIMGAYLWYTASTLKQENFFEAKKAWGNRELYDPMNNGVSNLHEM